MSNPQAEANPITGRYKPTKRTLEFKAVVAQRRAEVAEAAKLQRRPTLPRSNAVIAKAEAAEGCTRSRTGPRRAQ